MSINYLTEKEIEVLHLAIMKKHNDLDQAGIGDEGLFQSAVYRPQTEFGGTDLFPTMFEKAAALLDGLVNNHSFHNGNKRTAWVATKKYSFSDGLANELEKYSHPN